MRRTRRPAVCVVAYTSYASDRRVRRYVETLCDVGYMVDVICPGSAPETLARETTHNIRFVDLGHKYRTERLSARYLLAVLGFFVKGAIALSWRHFNSIPDFLVFMAVFPRLCGCRVILDIHDLLPELFCQKFDRPTDSIGARVLTSVEYLSVHFASHVLVANGLWRDRLVERTRLDPMQCTAILNYADFRYCRPSSRLSIHAAPTLIYPGTFSHLHGVDVAVRAMVFVRKELPCARLKMYGWVGRNRYGEYVRRLIRELGVSDVVELHRPVSLEELARIYQEVDIGLVPKRSGIFSSEAFSTKILDYMAVGIPVVASRTPIDEYYFDDSQISFFPPGDSRALARSVIELWHDTQKRASLIRNGARFVQANNWDAKKDEYLSIVGRVPAGQLCVRSGERRGNAATASVHEWTGRQERRRSRPGRRVEDSRLS
jgi:glycosyltransferase involved in cell wall biosynthesis